MSSSFDDSKQVTRMNKCRCNNCTNLKIHDAPDCGNHGEPHKCATCDGMASHNMIYCTMCQRKRKRDRQSLKNQRLTAEPKVKYSKERDVGLEFTPWVPRPKPEPIMSDEEQHRIDLEVRRKLITKSGEGHGKPRVLSPEEIANIAHTITPVHKIPALHFGGAISWS